MIGHGESSCFDRGKVTPEVELASWVRPWQVSQSESEGPTVPLRLVDKLLDVLESGTQIA